VVPSFLMRSLTVIHWTLAAASTASWTVSIVAELQVVPMQTKLGPRQSALLEQVVRQALVVVLHTYGEQEVDAGVLQVPVPLQLEAAVNVEPVQVGPPHCVPDA
jgi:hypothetical protein